MQAVVTDDNADQSLDSSDVDNEGGCGDGACASASTDRGHWKKQLLNCNLPSFRETFSKPSSVASPLAYFKLTVTAEVIDMVVKETNEYSTDTTGKSLNITAAEVEQFIGMYVMMGLIQMPSVTCHFETGSRCDTIADVMSRSRFEGIMGFLHFADNLNATDDMKNDKGWKIRPWLTKVQESFSKIEPEKFQSVDGIMIGLTGRCGIKQYMSMKPHPWGIKLWGRAGSSSILYCLELYQGQAD